MCRELLIEVNEKSDIRYIKEQIRQNFSLELNWLERLLHIIASEKFIFVHAGITTENLGSSKGSVLKTLGVLKKITSQYFGLFCVILRQ